MSLFKSPPIRRYLGGRRGGGVQGGGGGGGGIGGVGDTLFFFFVCRRRTPSSRISPCNYTPPKTFIPLLFTERDERRERQGHVIAPLAERGGERVGGWGGGGRVRQMENRRTKGW